MREAKPMKSPARIVLGMFCGAMALAAAAAQADSQAFDAWHDQLAKGAEPKAVAA